VLQVRKATRAAANTWSPSRGGRPTLFTGGADIAHGEDTRTCVAAAMPRIFAVRPVDDEAGPYPAPPLLNRKASAVAGSRR